jgi:hypothetical protein
MPAWHLTALIREGLCLFRVGWPERSSSTISFSLSLDAYAG